MTDARAIAMEARAWPFVEARNLLARMEKSRADKDHVLFQTGFGPSGLPHIGTFSEVARTTMVRHAFSELSDLPTRLIAFSDDMDGMRKIAPNLPEQEMLKRHLGQPLSRVPDPFGSNRSFAEHNNDMLKAFLDAYGFDYEFVSSSECYRSGLFDDTLRRVAEHYDEIMAVMLPSLGAERRETYSPFLPVSPETGRVLEVPMKEVRANEGIIVFEDENGALTELPFTGGNTKLQWRVDWAMRWAALDVDYEMYGKDLVDSARLSTRIVRIIGGTPPAGFHYELFTDEDGGRISKTLGNGLTMDEWRRYASPESLQFYMFQNQKKAKRLYFDVIPRCVDDYIGKLHAYADEDETARAANPVWHIHAGNPPVEEVPISFTMLLNLVSASHAEDHAALWGYIGQYVHDANEERHPLLGKLVDYAINYYHDFVKPTKRYRQPEEKERAALEELAGILEGLDVETEAEAIQTRVYDVGNNHGFEPLRSWFQALYEILLGQSAGPRMGSFIEVYGIAETADLIRRVLAGEDMNAA